MMKRCFVAVDLGATSGRVMLSRLENGRLSLEQVHRFPNEPVSYNGGLHWNMQGIWQQIRRGLDALGGFHVEHVDSIGVDSWGVDYALIGEGGALLENPYHYRDARTEGMMEAVCGKVGADRIYRETGVQFMPINTLYQLYAAQQKTPRLLSAADHLVTIPDLVNFWLTGVVACEYTNASTTQFLSHSTKNWAADLLRDLGIPTHLLTDIARPGTVLGPLRGGVSSLAALAGAKVTAPACHDTGSAVASVRAGGNTAFLSSGTWSLLGTEVAEPVVSATARELNFTNEGGVCGTIRLLKNITGLWLLEGCRKKWTAQGEEYSWADLLALAAKAAPVRSLIDPDDAGFVRPEDMTEAIGAFCRQTNQAAPASAGEYVRAILESLALKYRYVLDQLESITGTRLSKVRVIGGGAQNEMLNRFTADATGRTVIAGPAEATALGNVAMQMLACGFVGSLDEARNIVEVSVEPVRYEPSADAQWDGAYRTFRQIVEARQTSKVSA